ncbi:unnamed protein product [Oppiella nova]|uniref:Uncharacterized protein n=1 Tax=Oppiella nova TaxID=334625 RepID=A0A7R9MIT1_9ACAR|nr:unnamed protein product [Oppiella nova]CAG2178167.1 unnamed protein product [Oppiella nova]
MCPDDQLSLDNETSMRVKVGVFGVMDFIYKIWPEWHRDYVILELKLMDSMSDLKISGETLKNQELATYESPLKPYYGPLVKEIYDLQ